MGGLLAEFASKCPAARKGSLKSHPVAGLMRRFIAGEISAMFDLDETDTAVGGTM